jgi:hypothetical protein
MYPSPVSLTSDNDFFAQIWQQYFQPHIASWKADLEKAGKLAVKVSYIGSLQYRWNAQSQFSREQIIKEQLKTYVLEMYFPDGFLFLIPYIEQLYGDSLYFVATVADRIFISARKDPGRYYFGLDVPWFVTALIRDLLCNFNQEKCRYFFEFACHRSVNEFSKEMIFDHSVNEVMKASRFSSFTPHKIFLISLLIHSQKCFTELGQNFRHDRGAQSLSDMLAEIFSIYGPRIPGTTRTERMPVTNSEFVMSWQNKTRNMSLESQQYLLSLSRNVKDRIAVHDATQFCNEVETLMRRHGQFLWDVHCVGMESSMSEREKLITGIFIHTRPAAFQYLDAIALAVLQNHNRKIRFCFWEYFVLLEAERKQDRTLKNNVFELLQRVYKQEPLTKVDMVLLDARTTGGYAANYCYSISQENYNSLEAESMAEKILSQLNIIMSHKDFQKHKEQFECQAKEKKFWCQETAQVMSKPLFKVIGEYFYQMQDNSLSYGVDVKQQKKILAWLGMFQFTHALFESSKQINQPQ